MFYDFPPTPKEFWALLALIVVVLGTFYWFSIGFFANY